jgi:hypothetical protein
VLTKVDGKAFVAGAGHFRAAKSLCAALTYTTSSSDVSSAAAGQPAAPRRPGHRLFAAGSLALRQRRGTWGVRTPVVNECAFRVQSELLAWRYAASLGLFCTFATTKTWIYCGSICYGGPRQMRGCRTR